MDICRVAYSIPRRTSDNFKEYCRGKALIPTHVISGFMEALISGDLVWNDGKPTSPTQVSAAQTGPSVSTTPGRGRPPTPKAEKAPFVYKRPEFLAEAMDMNPTISDIRREQYNPPKVLPPGVTDPMEREAVEAWRTLSWDEQQTAKQEGDRAWYVRYLAKQGADNGNS
jgi:hypothetical protein